MFGMCMKGKKTKACCCVPLNVVGLTVGVILLVMNTATFLDQLRSLLNSEKKEATQIISLIFTALPLICALLSIFGILLKKASLVGLAVTCIMPSIILIVVAMITLWIGIFQASDSEAANATTSGAAGGNTYEFLNIFKFNGSNGKYMRGGIISALCIIVIALLCYVGDIFKSIATMLAKGENPWAITQHRSKAARPMSSETTMSV